MRLRRLEISCLNKSLKVSDRLLRRSLCELVLFSSFSLATATMSNGRAASILRKSVNISVAKDSRVHLVCSGFTHTPSETGDLTNVSLSADNANAVHPSSPTVSTSLLRAFEHGSFSYDTFASSHLIGSSRLQKRCVCITHPAQIERIHLCIQGRMAIPATKYDLSISIFKARHLDDGVA